MTPTFARLQHRPGAGAQRELVLVGGGHAHLGVLRAFSRRPIPGARLTLVAREAAPLYSGMLPGLIAGRFEPRACTIDLARVALAADARFIRGEACGLDVAGRLLRLADRPPLAFDVLSLNTGAAPALVPGAAEHALALRPFDRFVAAWGTLLARAAQSPEPVEVLVVGGGAAGVEVALALRHRLGSSARVGLVTGEAAPLPSHAPAARRLASAALAAADVAIYPGAAVTAVEPASLVLASGRLPFDAAIWATGAAPPGWLRETGLALGPDGFLTVDASLQAIGAPGIFAAGDIASVLPHPRARAGVYAVRQGPPLAVNLRRALQRRVPRPFRPQRRHLALVSTGASAIAVWGPIAVGGRWALRWKDRIDRRWVAMHASMPAMAGVGAVDEEAMRCGGCGAKLPAGVLGRVLGQLGLKEPDDAALLAPAAPGHQLVQTVDYFRALVDDPYLFGRIAANHALGDVAAMGARPRDALAIAALPPAAELPLAADLFAMLRGGQEVLEAAGARLIGGHSAEGAEAALGFAVTGEVAEGQALRRGGLRPGDVLLLTKPLGTGVILAAGMQGEALPAWTDAAMAAMQVLPFPAANCLVEHQATACADVTGFGLLNHLLEMLRASKVAAVVDLDRVPALPGALEALAGGVRSTLHPANLAAAAPLLDGAAAVPQARLALLLDPQTAGGLLAGVPAARAAACLATLRAAGHAAAIIGQVTAGPPRVRLEPDPSRHGFSAG